MLKLSNGALLAPSYEAFHFEPFYYMTFKLGDFETPGRVATLL
jgi:hypothetical protein